jgi:hypothetical protein
VADAPVIHDHAGLPRKLGNIAPPAGLTRAWRLYGDVPQTPLYGRAGWDGLLRPDPAADPFLPYVHDQGAVGQCNADATTAAMEACRAEQGLAPIKLSPADLYDQINDGVDEGSTLERGLQAAIGVGVGMAATSGLIWHPGHVPAPAGERARYRVLQAFLCPSFDYCFSAVSAGFKLITGIPWYAHYFPDAEGWIAGPMGSPVGGHAIFGYAPTKRAGRYGILHRQSWGEGYGLGGSFVIPEQGYQEGAVGGWWAVRLVVDEGGVVPSPR